MTIADLVQVFTEAEVRASLVFQLSKLCSFMLKASRLATGAAPWDALVAGTTLLLYTQCQMLALKRVGHALLPSTEGQLPCH